VFDVFIAGTQDVRERRQLKSKESLREHLPVIGPVQWLDMFTNTERAIRAGDSTRETAVSGPGIFNRAV